MNNMNASNRVFGHFSADGREYIITDPLAPPRAQVNFLWNDTIISGVNQFGSGEGLFNDRTLMFNHPQGRVQMIRHGRRYFYLRDLATGELWNTGLYPIKTPGAEYTCAVGLGYSRFTMRHAGIESVATVYVAPDEPVEIWEFSLRNLTRKTRRLWLCPYVEWDLGGYATFSSKYSYFRSTYDARRQAVLSFNTSNERPHDRYNAFVAADGEVAGWCGSPRQFFGPFGEPTRPSALVTGQMSNAEAWCEDLAGALAVAVKLAPGATVRRTVLIGSFNTDAEKNRLIKKVMPARYRQRAFAALRARKQRMAETVRVETPDERVNVLANIWTKQQIQLCVEFGRDGARGFRDTLQDAWATAPFNAPLARAKLVETMRHQHADGHGIRGWMPLQPHHYSDGPVWLVMAVCAYLKETGDFALLDEDVPFLDTGSASVLEHLLRGARFLSGDTGAHGLVLAHEGDWNDSLNWLCKTGKGESVWTSIGLYHSLDLLIELADELLRDPKLAAEMRKRKDRIAAAIETHGWDGNWYLAGYNDLGEPVGSHCNREGKVYLNPQTWAVMTGLATGERRAKCLRAIDELLESEHGSLTLTPAYTKEQPNVGRLSVLLPGMYENGTPYCHGTAFKIVADCCAGRGDEAWRSYQKVMPDNAQHPSVVSGCEPYAFTNQYLGPDNGRAGASISGWITGCAGWMFRAVIEYFAGIKPGYHSFTIEPCLPSAWPTLTVTRRLRGRLYRVRITRGDAGYVCELNGKVLENHRIAYRCEKILA
jgi:cellobiose phosphorylase